MDLIMMNSDDYQHFVCVAASNTPDELMAEYDKNKKVAPYTVYRYADAEKIRKKYIELYNAVLKNKDFISQYGYDKETLKESLKDLKDMDINEFYQQLTKDLTIDETTGDAISTVNKNGKWSSYAMGKIFSVPFITKDGREIFQAKKKDIAWDKIHLCGGDIYGKAWDMVINGDKPSNEYEEKIYENMKDKRAYFEKFETKENYISSNTAFWGYAFVSENTGWQEASETDDQFVWINNYYDLFIKNLPEDTLLTIFECRK